MKNFMLPKKSELKSVQITELDIEVPDLKNIKDSKSVAISKWLASTIEINLVSGKLKINNILPSKSEFAKERLSPISSSSKALQPLKAYPPKRVTWAGISRVVNPVQP